MATRYRNSVDTHDNHNVTKKKKGHHCKSIRQTGHFKLIPLWCIWRKLGHLQPTALSEAICVLCFISRKASPCTPYRKTPLPVPTKRKCKQKGNQRGWSVKRMEIEKWMTPILVKHCLSLTGRAPEQLPSPHEVLPAPPTEHQGCNHPHNTLSPLCPECRVGYLILFMGHSGLNEKWAPCGFQLVALFGEAVQPLEGGVFLAQVHHFRVGFEGL